MFKQLCMVAILGLTAMAVADEKLEDTRTFRKDGIEVTVGGNNGYQIKVDGVPFSEVSKLFVVDPSWKERYYGYNDDRRRLDRAVTTSTVPGGEGIVIPLTSSRADVVEATQTLELLPGRKFRVAVDIRMTSKTGAVLENRIASVTEGWFSNREWSATLKDGTTKTGTTPPWATGTEPRETTIVSDLKKATFNLSQGPVSIEAEGDAEISIVDYRRNQWAEGQQYYWLGVLGSELPQDGILNYEVTFTFPDMGASAKVAPVNVKSELKTDAVVYKTRPVEDRIIPTPKKVVWGDGLLPAASEIPVFVDTKGLADGEAVVQEYTKRLQSIYGITLKTGTFKDALIRITSGENMRSGFPSESDEAYMLAVTDDRISVIAKNNDGIRHALRTLEQLIRVDDDGNKSIRRCQVTDWPSLPFRGIHFFTGKDARDLQVKMISEILAPLKINNLVYQVDYVKWESQPQIHSDMLGMDKDDAIAVGKSAESQGIEVIPLVNTFGHSEWLLQRPEMRYLADDPDDPYAYDPSNPEVYEICEGIYEEAIEMFKPEIMHIGHDEVSLDGFPKKPANKAIGATQLLIDDTAHYYNFLKKKGIRTMIWGDMFLGPGEAPDATLADTTEEAARRRSLLPKDIMIADWHYKSAPVEEYRSLATFNSDGFDAIACTWFAPDNVVRFAKAAEEQRSGNEKTLGLLQTTWAGYSFDINSLLANVEQYSAYVLAAEAAWTGGYTGSEKVPFDFQEEFLRRWNGEYGSGTSAKGWLVNLDAAATAVTAKDLGLAVEAWDGLKPGENTLGDYRFRLPGKSDSMAVVALSGAFQKQESAAAVSVQVNAEAKKVYMAMATSAWVPDNYLVGSATFTLANGKKHKVELRYGKNILSISDARQTLLAPVAWKSEMLEPGQGGAVIHVLNWENPAPGEKLASVELTSAPGGPGILLFGISGARPEQ